MSRSFKKISCFKDYSRKGTKFSKRQANKTVRRYKLVIPNGKTYRKLYCSYNICDWKWLLSPIDKYYKKGKRK